MIQTQCKLQFQFTRHALSYNNITGKWPSELINKHNEPSITYTGALSTIKLSSNKHNFKSQHVCVSNLLRTWITAFLLYGTHLDPTTTLTLYICPYLKEFTTPIPVISEIKNKIVHGNNNIIYGFEQLSNQITTIICGESLPFSTNELISAIPTELKTGNYPDNFSITINRFLKFLNTFKLLRETSTWYNSAPNKIIFKLPNENGKWDKPQIVIVERTSPSDYYKLTRYCSFVDTIGPYTTLEGYLTNGNLKEFMEWYSINMHTRHDNDSDIIHIVTHSNVMKDYFKTEFEFELELESPEDVYQQIKNYNLCHFTTCLNTVALHNVPQISPGVKIERTKAQKEEQTLKKQIQELTKIKNCN